MPKCEHGLTSKECYVCASPKHAEQAEKQEPFGYFQYAMHFDALENLDEYYITTPEGQKLVTSLRQAIDAYTLSSKPPGLCMCGEPWRLESVHRKKSPCFDYIEREWVGLTDEEIEKACVPLGAAMLSFTEVARAIEANLKEKNT